MNTPILILGGKGMLGTDLAALLRLNGAAVTIRDLPEFDITRPDHMDAALKDIALVVNCAAFTNVDKAEDAPETAQAVNAAAVGLLGRLARERGAYVVHISTDFVFDGKGDRPYVETDTPRPLNVYGDSKWKGELALQASGCDHAILRVEWSYGRHGVHFIAKLLERAHTGVDLKVVDDQIGAPTWTADAARAILCLLRGRHTGLYHFASGGFVSRYDMARFVLQAFDLQNRISPCSSETFPMKAVRPKNSRFNTAKIQPLLDHPIRDWQTALSEFLSHGGLTPTPQ